MKRDYIEKKDNDIAAINEAIEKHIQEKTLKDIDFIAIIKEYTPEGSNLAENIQQIINDDFIKDPSGKHELSKKSAKKLGLFSLGLINAVANSFLGLPAAAILVGMDHLFMNPLALGSLTIADKILLASIALVILVIFIKIAYNQNYIKNDQQNEYIKYVNDIFAEYLCSTPEPQKILNKALYNKYLSKQINGIRAGNFKEENKNEIFNIEKKFAEKIASEAEEKKIADNSAEKTDNVMQYVNYVSIFAVSLFLSYFITVAITISIMPVLPIIPILCSILLLHQIIKYSVKNYYTPKQRASLKDQYYLALYRAMQKYRTNSNNFKEKINGIIDNQVIKDDLLADIKEEIKGMTDNESIKNAVSEYIYEYAKIYKNNIIDDEQLQKIENDHIMSICNKYQNRLSTVGKVLGTANAILNGILCSSLGMIGLMSIMAVFFPAIHFSIFAMALIAAGLFLGGAIHSFRFTRVFIKDIFIDFGKTLDKAEASEKHITTSRWLSLLSKKTYANRKAITISLFTSIALSTLGFIAIAGFLLSFNVSFGIVVFALVVTTLLNFVACNAVFTKTLLSSEKQVKYHAKLQESIEENEKTKIAKLKSRLKKHYYLAGLSSIVIFAICVSPLFSLTVVPATLITFVGFIVISIASGVADYKNIKQHNESLSDILNLRLRISIIALFGLAFGLSAGPAIGILAFSIMPAMPMPVILIISTLIGIAIGSSLAYTYSLVYWNAAVKPEPPKIDWIKVQESLIKNNQAHPAVEKAAEKALEKANDSSENKKNLSGQRNYK